MTRRVMGGVLLLILGAYQGAPLAASVAPDPAHKATVSPAAHGEHADHGTPGAEGDPAAHRPGCPWRNHAGPCPHSLRAGVLTSPGFASCPIPATAERTSAVDPGRELPAPRATWMAVLWSGSLDARPVPSTRRNPVASVEHRPPRITRA